MQFFACKMDNYVVKSEWRESPHMGDRKRSIFMSSMVYSRPNRKVAYGMAPSHQVSKVTIKAEIANDVSEACTKGLLVALQKMTKDISHGVVIGERN